MVIMRRTSYEIGKKLYTDVVEELTALVDVEYAGLKEAPDTLRESPQVAKKNGRISGRYHH